MGRRYTKALAPTLLGSKRGQPKGGEGAVRASAREAYGGPDDIGFEDGRVLDHPILRELALFQTSIGQRDFVYLPSLQVYRATQPALAFQRA